MLIKEWMTRPVTTINWDNSLNDAAKIIATQGVSILPVIKKGRLKGIISDGDIKKATPSGATTLDKFELPHLLDSIKISSLMSMPVSAISEDQTIEEAAEIMLNKHISGMPVLGSAGNVEGIITKSDVFRCFVSFTGVSSKGQIFIFKLHDRPGTIKEVVETIRESNGRLRSVMASYDDIEEGFKKVFFHALDIPSALFPSLAEKFQDTGGLLYAADRSQGTRVIYDENVLPKRFNSHDL